MDIYDIGKPKNHLNCCAPKQMEVNVFAACLSERWEMSGLIAIKAGW